MWDVEPGARGAMPATPTAMRQSVAGYVEAVHAAYLDEARALAPAVRARLPLVAAGRFWVAAAAAGQLHLVATEEPLARAEREGAATEGRAGALQWTLCFYDPSVLAGLGAGALRDRDVRRLLGITTALYHLVLPSGSALEPHRARHTGVGLAATHAAAATALEDLRRAFPHSSALVDELLGAIRAGLAHAQALLAHRLLPGDDSLARLARDDDPDPSAVQRALLAAVRRSNNPR